MSTEKHSDNPFFRAWNTPSETPPFNAIKPEHFAPAYARASGVEGERTLSLFNEVLRV